MLSVESTLYNILKQIEKQCEEDSDPSSLLYCDALLFSAVHYLHGYLRALLGKREDPGPAVTPQSMLYYLSKLHVYVPDAIALYIKALEGRYLTSERPRQAMTIDCLAVVSIRANCDDLSGVIDYLFSDNVANTLSKSSARYFYLYRKNRESNGLYVPVYMVEKYSGDPRVRHILRSLDIFTLALRAPENWREESIHFLKAIEPFRMHLYAYARGVCLKAGQDMVYVDTFDKMKISRYDYRVSQSKYAQDLKVCDFNTLLESRATFRNTVCNLALFEMPEGMCITDSDCDYVEVVAQVLYLIWNYYRTRHDNAAASVITGYVRSLFVEKLVNGRLCFDEVTSLSALTLGDVLGTIDKPQFERYRDKAHRRKYTFDYITVDVSLLTRYGKQSLQVARKHLPELKARVMEAVRATKRLADKPLLQDLLYVKEFSVSGSGYIITALVEFKPGAEEALSEGKPEENQESKTGVQNLYLK